MVHIVGVARPAGWSERDGVEANRGGDGEASGGKDAGAGELFLVDEGEVFVIL